jgi:peptidyl-prolyl cis-trans isomerase B (cyclophilin B)
MKQLFFLFGITLLIFACGTPKQIQTNNEPKIIIATEFGNMEVKLYNETPKHKENFIKLATEGFYNDLLFHRVIANFMIQGGDPESRNAPAGKSLGVGGPGYTLPAEFNTKFIHKKGALAAARTGGASNPLKRSSGSQFYIVQGKVVDDNLLAQIEKRNKIIYTPEQKETYKTVGGTPFLDNEYTVFGEVTIGLDVIDKIAAVAKNRQDRPLKDVKMIVKVIN